MMFMSVDLPEPDGPMIATYSFGVDVEVHAVQGVDLLGAHLVDAVQVADLDQHRASALLPAPSAGLSRFTFAPGLSSRSALYGPDDHDSPALMSPNTSIMVSLAIPAAHRHERRDAVLAPRTTPVISLSLRPDRVVLRRRRHRRPRASAAPSRAFLRLARSSSRSVRTTTAWIGTAVRLGVRAGLDLHVRGHAGPHLRHVVVEHHLAPRSWSGPRPVAAWCALGGVADLGHGAAERGVGNRVHRDLGLLADRRCRRRRSRPRRPAPACATGPRPPGSGCRGCSWCR